MVGETRSDGTSRLVSYEITSPDAPGPVLVASAIAQDEAISSELSLLNDQGSTVEFGDLLMLPIGESILWVRPLYVAADGDASVPTVQRVIVFTTINDSEQIAIADDLGGALSALFDGEDFSDILGTAPAVEEPEDPADDPDTEPSEPSEPSDLTAEEILALVSELFDARSRALSSTPPDEVLAAQLLEQISALLEVAAALDGVQAATPDPDATDA